MRVALTGVSGFIGSFLARRLVEHGHAVTGLVRVSSRRDHVEAFVDRFVVGNQDDAAAWDELLDGADAVIHNSVDWPPLRDRDLRKHLHSNLNGSVELLHASSPRPFVFISTIAVHHDMRPRSFNEAGQGVIDEDHPLRPDTVYGAYKAAVEAHLWQVHFESGRHAAAVRPCAVYGIDPRLERSHGYRTIQKLRAGEPIDRPGGGKFVHVEDVAAAAVAALEKPEAAGMPFNLVDCYARWSDWAVWAAEIMGIDPSAAGIDTSSPAQPKNVFTKDGAASLGVDLDRGHEGIRRHLRELIEVSGKI